MTQEQYDKLVAIGKQIAVGWLESGELHPEYEFSLVKIVCADELGIDLCDDVIPEVLNDVWDAVYDGFRDVYLKRENDVVIPCDGLCGKQRG